MTEERLQLINATTNLDDRAGRKDKNIDDITLFKQIVLKDLYSDQDIIEVLHNVELEKQHALPEDYRNVNIFAFLKIPDTQSVVKNFICFEVSDIDELFHNKTYIERRVTFRAVSHEDDIVTGFGIDRQDLLGMLIKDRYSWTNIMGMRLEKEYDVGRIAENGYYYREIRFKVVSPNAMVQKGTYIVGLDQDRGRYDGRT